MIRSMTGFGSLARDEAGVRASATVRSVNHRFLEIQCQMPRRLASLEAEVKERVQGRLSRGRVDVALAVSSGVAVGGAVVVNRALVESLVRALRSVQSEQGLAGDVRIGDLARFPGTLEVLEGDSGPDDVVREFLLALVDDVLAGVVVMRTEEGRRLASDLMGRVEQVEQATLRIEAISRDTRATRVETLRQRAAETCTNLGLDDARLYQEIVRAVERHDVTEELERLRSHVAMVRSLVSGPEVGVGKRLDFLAQELMREANTIGSKASDAALVQAVVELKSEIERFREQVQNVE